MLGLQNGDNISRRNTNVKVNQEGMEGIKNREQSKKADSASVVTPFPFCVTNESRKPHGSR